MISRVALLIVSAGIAVFFTKRVLRYLRYYQQEEYEGVRFLSWLFKTGSVDKRGTLVCLVAALWAWACPNADAGLWISLVGAIFLVAIAYGEPDPLTTGKIRLSLTERANRIVRTASIIFVLMLSAATVFWAAVSLLYDIEDSLAWWWFLQVFVIQGIPLSLLTANALLGPYERRIQARFLDEAVQRIRGVNPFIIGITGSYGKTSTKIALGEMLKVALGPTFVPPKSFNTLMGNVREIRERLATGTKYAVIEMGAYGVGSIHRLTKLAPPRAAIVTAVGIMHLERFGSAENVFRAKSELAQALPKDGLLVCNGDDSGARRIASTYPSGRTLLYGFDNSRKDLTCVLAITRENEKGTEFTLQWKGKQYTAHTPLCGIPAIGNIGASFLLAAELGAQPELLLGVIRNLTPVDNRLSIDRREGVTYVRDAYNSNPVGFRAALKVLKNMPAERRILMTPGMIELGDRQYKENEEVACEAANVVHKVLVVGNTNKAALVAGFARGGLAEESIVCCDSRSEALARLSFEAKKGDAVLIENDLTDLYEVREAF